MSAPPPPGPYGYGTPPPPGGYGAPPPPPGWHPPRPTSQKAVWAFVCSLIGVVLCCFPVGIAGIVLGAQAKREIAESYGQLDGAGLAQAGFIVGIVVTTISALYLLFTLGTFFLPLALLSA
ncbi:MULTISPECIES: DUF4190 domain-containing protein [Mumia]|uniref:DUF4190 domain-containing protein n=1 Tax=Mumia TaxID=1546255 RepID=UPI0015F99C5F|nr:MULTISPECIES: DUF4190 domain-containing protein [unclassified Mumia]QMW67798.1 DUF4190 domain-containing protein [Mumia sp. ZJ1417]